MGPAQARKHASTQAGVRSFIITFDVYVIVNIFDKYDNKRLGPLCLLSVDAPGFITLVSVIELTWVLESAFELNRSQIVEVFQRIMSVDVFKVDRVGIVASALRIYANSKADFADCLIERFSAHAGCAQTMTFDRHAAKTGGMVLIA